MEPERKSTVTELLEQDHADIARLLDRLGSVAPGMRQELLDELETTLEAHVALEDEVLYPEIEANEALKQHVLEAKRDNSEITILMDELVVISPQDETWSSQFQALKEKIEHHVEKVQTGILPAIAEELEESELSALATLIASRHRTRLEAA